MLEIYNECVRDLLSVDPTHKLDIKQGSDGVYVPGLTQVAVSQLEEVNEVVCARAPWASLCLICMSYISLVPSRVASKITLGRQLGLHGIDCIWAWLGTKKKQK